jgi:hypothetical protein
MREDTNYTLKGLEGDLIRGYFPALSPNNLEVRLLKVEAFGIWIESQSTMEQVLALHGVTTAPTTLAIFLPWSGVKLILAGIDVPSVSREML